MAIFPTYKTAKENGMKKVIALMMTLAMIFAFAACKDKAPETLDEDTTAAVDNVVVQDETEADESAINAPVNGSKAEIVSFFNKYATAMKNYTGKVLIQKGQGTISKINSISGGSAISGSFKPLLPYDFPQMDSKTFEGGTAEDGTTIAKFLPADDLAEYNVPVDGVKSATCTKNGEGWKVSITLSPETGTSFQYIPKNHSTCFDILTLAEESLSTFELVSANVNYQSGTYTFVLNSDGTIASINVIEPVNYVCKFEMGVSIDADFTCTWKQEYRFTY